VDTPDLSLSTPAQWLDRATRFERWSRHADAAAAFRQALSAADNGLRYPALLGLARSLASLGDQTEATRTCQRAIGLYPGRAEGHVLLASLQVEAGDLISAAASAKSAHGLEPSSAEILCLVATIALRRGRAAEAAAAADEALRCAPASQRAMALRHIAGSGGRENDLSGLIRISSPPPPCGFDSMAAFNRSLAEAVQTHEALDDTSHTGPLVHGARLHDLSELPPHLLRAIDKMFRAAAMDWTDLAREPFTVRGWANVMAAGAFEKPHIHEGGRVSGVYYPQLPTGGAGDLVFGQHDLGEAVPPLPPLRVAPAEGMLVLFPCWLYHSTEPFQSEGLRISIAVDLC
jgi:uncharacterized protein (TIGR02466 family)